MSTQTKCGRCGARFVKADTTATVCPQCAFAAAITAPEEVEAEADSLLARLPGLHALGKLGRGGMGVVYRARQTKLERDVAVKVISSEFASDPDFQRRFSQEAQILASLDHPNIVTIHDCGIQGDLEYFVMEYVDGESLRALLDRGAVKEPLRVVLDVAEALAYAHDRGVIHRDIKPENILIRRDGRVKVVDFGIARLGLGTSRLTKSDLVIGTPAYMAPEQRENPAAVDHRVDVYALGLLAREMLTGKGPTDGMPSVTGVDDGAAQVILRAIERDPSRRYQTMREMASAIRALLEPAEGRRPPRIPLRERAARLRASRLFWAMMTGAAFLVAVLADRLSDILPPDPRSEFERILSSDQPWVQEEALDALKDARITDRVDALLAAEASSRDANRSWKALRVAYLLDRASVIPADVRARILLHHSGPAEQIGFGKPRGVNTGGIVDAAEAVRDAGPVMASEAYFDLVEGKLPKERENAAVCGISEVADAALVGRMRDFLLEKRDSPYASAILTAFAGRADLPLPYNPVGKVLPPSVIDTYVRHLPTLLDQTTKEADWEEAVRLVADLDKLGIADMGLAIQTWNEEHGTTFARTGTPIETLARGLGLPSPLDENAVDVIEQRIGKEEKLPHPYVHALVVHWWRTGRPTLPHNRMAFMPWEGPGPTEMNRYESFNAREVLSLTNEPVRWEATTLFFPTLAGGPLVVGVGSGVITVRPTLSHEVATGAEPPVLHAGLRPVHLGGTDWKPGRFTWMFEGYVERVNKEECNLVGQGKWSLDEGDRHGGGSSGGVSRCCRGEARMLDMELKGRSPYESRCSYVTIFVANPSPLGDSSQHWREGIASALRGALARKQLTSTTLDPLVSVAAWTPVPEAVDPLKALWAMRADLFDHPYEEHTPPELRKGPQVQKSECLNGAVIPDLVGAALLMMGEPAPLKEPGLLARLPREVVLRIRLFSPSGEIRRAAVGGEEAIQTPGDADAVEKRLDELNEDDAAVAERAKRARREAPSQILRSGLVPWAMVMGMAILFGCLMPWRPLRGGALAHALVFLGLLLLFVTIDVGGRTWFPAAGDLLLLVAAFLYAGWGMRLLTLAMALGGALGFMYPSSPWVETVSACLVCLYVAVLCLDFLSRRLPGRIRALDGLALLAAWWALLVPIGFCQVAMLYLGLTRDTWSLPLFSVYGALGNLFVLSLVVGPLWLARANRLARGSVLANAHREA